jgi:hypothetical protein
MARRLIPNQWKTHTNTELWVANHGLSPWMQDIAPNSSFSNSFFLSFFFQKLKALTYWSNWRSGSGLRSARSPQTTQFNIPNNPSKLWSKPQCQFHLELPQPKEKKNEMKRKILHNCWKTLQNILKCFWFKVKIKEQD